MIKFGLRSRSGSFSIMDKPPEFSGTSNKRNIDHVTSKNKMDHSERLETIQEDPSKDKPILYLNENCHSTSIKGNQFLFNLDQYSIRHRKGRDDIFPILLDKDTSYSGVNLQRIIFKNIGVDDIDQDKLIQTMENDHRHCRHHKNEEDEK